jgi:hypothetical protein
VATTTGAIRRKTRTSGTLWIISEKEKILVTVKRQRAPLGATTFDCRKNSMYVIRIGNDNHPPEVHETSLEEGNPGSKARKGPGNPDT